MEDALRDLQVDQTHSDLKQPPLYKVMIHNDDYTPMDFVVNILQTFFAMSRDRAVSVMLQIHNNDKAVCGIYTYDIAETKVQRVNDCAMEHEYPLLCKMEAV